jgi:hypothetical protein
MKKEKQSALDAESPKELLLAAKVAARVQIKEVLLIKAHVSNEMGFVATGEVTLSAKTEYMLNRESKLIFVKPSFVAYAEASEGRPLEILATYLVVYGSRISVILANASSRCSQHSMQKVSPGLQPANAHSSSSTENSNLCARPQDLQVCCCASMILASSVR